MKDTIYCTNFLSKLFLKFHHGKFISFSSHKENATETNSFQTFEKKVKNILYLKM